MSEKSYYKINRRIVAVMLILFAITCIVVCTLNIHNLRNIYEKFFTQRALITNDLIAAEIDGDEIKNYVDLISNQDDAFKRRQLQFYYDRKELIKLQAENAPKEDQDVIFTRLEAFSREMFMLKTDGYWKMTDKIITLKNASNSKYVYLFADTGLMGDDGEKLYTFIFDAEDKEVYDSIENDGLGTVYDGEDVIADIYVTKKPLETIIYYNDEPYGECYFTYAPILDSSGNVVAILGADLELGEMNEEITASVILFTIVFLAFVIIMIAFIYFFISRNVTNPLIQLTATAQKLSDGDVYSAVPAATLKNRCEIGRLAHAINDMSSIYQSMIKNTGELFEAANVGKLDIRNDASKYKGSIRKVIEQINDTLDATVLYLNSIPESILIINKNFETYFKNEKYSETFGNMSAAGFTEKLFRQDSDDLLEFPEYKLANALKCENYNKVVWINDKCFSVVLKEINFNETAENSVIVIAVDITELMNEKENAQAAAKAKSEFLSRMSHEMRTPMNAIIGMTKIANNTDDLSNLKYCLSTIAASSEQLLGIINDVLDISKIEAGKFELDNNPMNVEKLLMKICNLVIDKAEKKGQKLHVIMGKNMGVNYIGDELRLSQVLTNLLSNAVKFTPEGGIITLSVNEISKNKDKCTLQFSVADTGIGITKEQINRLFTSFEQADGSITRRFGGTGLGLAISKNIVEKMGGSINVESEYGRGATFRFEVEFECASHQNQILVDGIRPADLKILVVESDNDIRANFLSILDGFGITVDQAANARNAISMTQAVNKTNSAYDIIFLDYDMPDADAVDVINQLNDKIDKNTIIIVTTFTEWQQIENKINHIGINRYITKPLFPSAILDAINNLVGQTLKTLDIKTDSSREVPDFSDVCILLSEDVDINREILMALLAETRVNIDIAENGIEAVEKFKANPDKYHMVFMDIQMPEMDGYEATRIIRNLNIPAAASIPIVAMTANVFKEDIERCLECGMNDHLAKPIDEKAVISKIEHYVPRSRTI